MIWLLLFLSVFILYYAVYLIGKALAFGKTKGIRKNLECTRKVSVIIPARNEEENIEDCLRSVLEQSYPPELIEIIVVNDHSEDGTVGVVRSLMKSSDRIRLLDLDDKPRVAYKKAAISMAIDQAGGEIILTTDADCICNQEWVETMVSHFAEDVEMVSGPVELTGNSLFMKFQALEFIGLIMVGAAGILQGRPNMCNGANLGYTKNAFFKVNGFEGVDGIASGDDELLMHKLAERSSGSIAFAYDPKAIVRTAAQPNLKAFANQRRRWVSKSRLYKKKGITFTLSMSYLAVLSIPVYTLLGILDWRSLCFAAGALLLKMVAEGMVLLRGTRFFKHTQLLLLLPMEQFLHIAYVLWVGIAGNIKKYTWKGRIVR